MAYCLFGATPLPTNADLLSRRNSNEIQIKIQWFSPKCGTWKACLAAILCQGSELTRRNFTENWIKITWFPFKKMHFKFSSTRQQPFCLRCVKNPLVQDAIQDAFRARLFHSLLAQHLTAGNLPAVRAVQGDCQRPVKYDGKSHCTGRVSPQSIANQVIPTYI